MLAETVWGFLSFIFVISIHSISIIPQYLQIKISKLTKPIDINRQSLPAAQIQNSKIPQLSRLRIPDKEVQRKRLRVRSGKTLSQNRQTDVATLVFDIINRPGVAGAVLQSAL